MKVADHSLYLGRSALPDGYGQRRTRSEAQRCGDSVSLGRSVSPQAVGRRAGSGQTQAVEARSVLPSLYNNYAVFPWNLVGSSIVALTIITTMFPRQPRSTVYVSV